MADKKSTALLFALLGISSIIMNGCALRTTRPEPKSSLAAVEDNFKQVDAQIEATEEALQELVTCEEFEVKEAYGHYAVTAQRMELLAERLNRDFEAMRRLGLGYFREWDKQTGGYVNPQIRLLDKARLDELSQSYLNLTEQSRETRRDLLPFRFDVKAIHDGLRKRVTPIKVEYFTNIAEKARVDAQSLKESIRKVLAVIAQTKVQMAEFGIQNGLRNGAPAGTSSGIPNRMGNAPGGPQTAIPNRMGPQNGTPTAMPNGTVPQDGTPTAMPNGTVPQNGATTAVPNGTAPQNGATTAVPNGTAPQNGATTAVPNGMAPQNGSTTAVPNGMAPQNGATTAEPNGMGQQNGVPDATLSPMPNRMQPEPQP